MRGREDKQARLVLTTLSPEKRVSAKHPLREIKKVADAALAELSPLFDQRYSDRGRRSLPPERLLKASVLMALYTVRSERLFCEQLDYNLLFRWFLDMDLEESSFDHSTFSRNRERLIEHDIALRFFEAVVRQAKLRGLTSSEHFSVDGTLIEAWASHKSFKPKDGSGGGDEGKDGKSRERDFHNEKRSNETHESTTDPDAKLYRKGKGKEAKLRYTAHALMENRNGLVVGFTTTKAVGTTERDEAIGLLDRFCPGEQRITVGADKGYDTKGFVQMCRELQVTPHVARNVNRPGGSAIDGRTTSWPGYEVSQVVRKRIEEVFGWMKIIGNFARTKYRGRQRVDLNGLLVATSYNLLRIGKLATE